MEEHALKGEYISALRNGVLSYSGSQRWLDSGALPEEASTDGVHLNKEYCLKWLDYLKSHTNV